MMNNNYYGEVEPEGKIKNVAIYARKSRAEEGEKDLQNHLFRLVKRSELNEWNYTIYKEVSSGGSLTDRPQMLKLLEDCKTNIYDAVVVVDIDRLSRGKGADLDTILGVFRNHNVKIVQESPYEVYDLTNTNHAQMLEMKMFFGNMELMQTKKRFKEGKRLARYLGKWTGGTTPFGYEVDYKTKKLKAHKTEAEVIVRMKDIFLETFNTVDTAWQLNKEGYRTRVGSEWTSSRVAKYLKNEVYTGSLIYNKGEGSRRVKDNAYSSGVPYKSLDKSQWKKVENSHEPLFSKDEYDRIMKHFNLPNRKRRYNKKVYPLTGICVTPTGEPYHCVKTKEKSESADTLIVRPKSKYHDATIYKPVEIEVVNTIIQKVFMTFKEGIVENIDEKDNSEEIKKVNKRLKNLKNEIENIDRAIEKIQEGFIYNLYSAEEAKNLKVKQEEKITQKEGEVAELLEILNQLSNVSSLERLTRVEKFLDDIVNQNNPEILNEIYKSVIKNIIIDKTNDTDLDITINFL